MVDKNWVFLKYSISSFCGDDFQKVKVYPNKLEAQSAYYNSLVCYSKNDEYEIIKQEETEYYLRTYFRYEDSYGCHCLCVSIYEEN